MIGASLARPLLSRGWMIRRFGLVSAGSFPVQTTLPIMRPRSMLFFSSGGDFGFAHRVEHDFVDDAHDRGVDRAILAFGGVSRRASADHQNSLACAGADRIHSDQVTGFVRAFGGDGLDDEKFFALEARVLPRGNHRADDASENHSAFEKLKSNQSASTCTAIPARLVPTTSRA